MTEEAGEASGFGFVTVDGEDIVAAATGVGDVISAATEGAAIPGIYEVEDQRSMDANCGMQTFGWLPGAIADASDELTIDAGGMEWEAMPTNGNGEAFAAHATGFDLEAFE